MQVQLFKPQAALSTIINHYLYYDYSVAPGQPIHTFLFPPLPENFIYLYVFETPKISFLNGATSVSMPNGVFIGPQTNNLNIQMPRHNVCIRISLHPGAMYRLGKIPLFEYSGQGLDSHAVFGAELEPLLDKLRHAKTFEGMHEILELFLLKKAYSSKDSHPIDSLIAKLLTISDHMLIDEIAWQANMSMRQLERVFLQRVGLSPKFYQRLGRFARAYFLREQNPQMTWTQIAYQSGYYDQMHFIRDFKQFAGTTPVLLDPEILHSSVFTKTAIRF